MAAFNLASYLFGSGSDVLSATDIYLDPGVLVNTGRGDDSITGTGNSGATSSFVGGAGSAGISIGGTLHTDQWKDTIRGQGGTGGVGTGTEANGGRGGDGIGNTGTLATGIDDDVVIGTGGSGGSATGFGGDGGHGILNKGIIDMGDGNDVVTGIGGAGGTGPLFSGNRGAGIYNTGTILMGKGADSLTGSGLKAIFNGDRGRIDTGSGNDTVDALAGGFSGVGLIALGGDRDTLKGFGMGRFDGGSGTDTLLIGAPGTYTISTLGRDLTGYYTISNGQIGMYVQNFELIGNATTAQTFTFAAAQQLIVQA